MVPDGNSSPSPQSVLSTRCYGTGEFMYVISSHPENREEVGSVISF